MRELLGVMELLKILTAVVTSTYMYKYFIHVIYVLKMPPISLYVWPNLGVLTKIPQFDF